MYNYKGVAANIIWIKLVIVTSQAEYILIKVRMRKSNMTKA